LTRGRIRVEALNSHHDRSKFECGVEPLDRYFRTQAGQDARKNMAAPFVLVLPDYTIAGYYTLSSTSVQLGELSQKKPAVALSLLPSIHCETAEQRRRRQRISGQLPRDLFRQLTKLHRR